MKSLFNIIQEKLKIGSKTKLSKLYQPKDLKELKSIIKEHIDKNGLECDLNDIDVSNITNMRGLFNKYDIYSNTASSQLDINELYKFNGNISEWDVSNVTNMKEMFELSEYTGENGDISNWNVEKVEDMWHMFYRSYYNGDISKWNPKSVKRNWYMFVDSPLENDEPKWYKPKFDK